MLQQCANNLFRVGSETLQQYLIAEQQKTKLFFSL